MGLNALQTSKYHCLPCPPHPQQQIHLTFCSVFVSAFQSSCWTRLTLQLASHLLLFSFLAFFIMPVLDVSELNIVLSILGTFIIFYGIISVKIKQVWYLGEASKYSSLSIVFESANWSSARRNTGHHLGPNRRPFLG